MKGFQLKINVNGSSEIIWRRLIVPEALTFSDLQQIIQIIFGLDPRCLFDFKIFKKGIWVSGEYRDLYDITWRYEIISEFELLKDHLEEGLNLTYYSSDFISVEFKIRVEKVITDVKRYPIVIKYRGRNLVRDRDDDYYEELIDHDFERAIDLLVFDNDSVNYQLMDFEIQELLKDSIYREAFEQEMQNIEQILDNQTINNFQVVKIQGQSTNYWVIFQNEESYCLLLYEDYNDLLEGFYLGDGNFFNDVFNHCWSFLLFEPGIEQQKGALDDQGKFLILKNEPGYLPALAKTNESQDLLICLKELAIGLQEIELKNEEDEILEIKISNGKYQSSHLFTYDSYDTLDYYQYFSSDVVIDTNKTIDTNVCLDIVALPSDETFHTFKLKIYAVISDGENYVIVEIPNPVLDSLFEELVALILEFSNDYGKPECIKMSNLNILYLLKNFLDNNQISYERDRVIEEIDSAIIDAFDLDDEIERLLDNPELQDFFDLSEEELEEQLEKLVNEHDLLN